MSAVPHRAWAGFVHCKWKNPSVMAGGFFSSSRAALLGVEA
jgi:hypothetical protein